MAKKVYVGVDGKARRVKKIYVGVGATVSLPSGYTQVEYIQSSGSQYINTGFKPNNASRMVLDIDVSAKSSQSSIFGTRNGSGSSGFNVWTWNDNAGYQIDYGTQQFTGVGGNSSGRHILDLHQHVFYVDGTAVNIASTQSFSCSYNAYLFMVSSGGNLMTSYPCIAKLYACQIYDNGTKVRDFVPCKNPSGTVGLYDTVNGKFYTNEGTGSFTAGASLTSSGVARKVKKGYIGVGGVARQFFSSEPELVYQGTATELSVGRTNLAGTSVGNYALFAGGEDFNGNNSPAYTYFTTVDAYNTSLSRSTPTALSVGREGIAATSVGSYALFGGGRTSLQDPKSTVDAYNASLTRSTPTALSAARSSLAATSVGNYALFGGGFKYQNSAYTYYDTVDAYNASLTRSTPTALSVKREALAATSVGNYALFGGGSDGSYKEHATVDAYNTSLVRSTPTALSEVKTSLSATKVGNYALFGGGLVGVKPKSSVDAYSASLTRSSLEIMSREMYGLKAVSTGNYALFGGGGPVGYTQVNAYNASLVKSVPTNLSIERQGLAAASVGKYALFAGGSTRYTTVDVYQEIE